MRPEAQPGFSREEAWIKIRFCLFFFTKIVQFRLRAEQTDATHAYRKGGPGGRAPSRWVIIAILRQKIAILVPFQSHSHVFMPYK